MTSLSQTQIDAIMAKKWRTLNLLSITVLLALGVWFSASAVVPVLTTEWSLGNSGRSWLTMSVQIGFVVGALVFYPASIWPIGCRPNGC